MTNASCFTGEMREMAPGAGGGLARCARFAAGPWHPRLTLRQRGNGPMAPRHLNEKRRLAREPGPAALIRTRVSGNEAVTSLTGSDRPEIGLNII